jgi:hypothetical protein
MPLSSRKGRRRNNPAPFIFFGLVFYLLLSDGVLAETLQKLSLEELTREADVIVRGRIQKVSSQPTADRSNITTVVEVAVVDQWKGQKTSTLSLRQPGGSAGGIAQAVPGLPQFSIGEDVILFLKEIDGGYVSTVGGKQGKFVVKTDPQSKEEIIEDLTGKSQPAKDFLAHIRPNLK